MWVCLNTGFVSIVEHPMHSDLVMVRGRRKEDVAALVKDEYFIEQTDARDYRFRAIAPKAKVARMVSDAVESIDYGNFKDSVEDDNLHKFYAEVWSSGIHNLDPGWIDRQLGFDGTYGVNDDSTK